MHSRHPWFVRLFSAFLAVVFGLSALLIAPASPATASIRQNTLFEATFEGTTAGPLTTDLAVETGTVVAEDGSVAIVNTGASRALALDGSSGQSTALLQWSNYDGALPGVPPPAIHVTIDGIFTADAATATGATFGILAGTTFFELFTFGATGALTRAGAPLGLAYATDKPVALEARVLFPGGTDGTVQNSLPRHLGTARRPGYLWPAAD